jgi:NADP-dependent 3-hydroxy acid dehydrogenase YdfG
MLNGQVAWVTGAGSGIGEATAKALAHLGAAVVLSGRRAHKLDAVANSISEGGGQAHAFPGDLADAEISKATAAYISERFGRLDILINNAGHNIPRRAWGELTPAGVMEVLGANLAAPLFCITAALPFMRAQRCGQIINIASIDGIRISAVGGPAYTATKHGVVALSRTLNIDEAKNGIRCSAICPGGVDTEILYKRPVVPDADRRAKLLRPQDIADVIVQIVTSPRHVLIEEIVVTPFIDIAAAQARGPY